MFSFKVLLLLNLYSFLTFSLHIKPLQPEEIKHHRSPKERIEKVADDFYQLGLICEIELQFSEAFNYYELAAKVPGSKPFYANKAGEMASFLEKNDLAITYFELAIDRDNATDDENDDIQIYWQNLGATFLKKGEIKRADGCFEMVQLYCYTIAKYYHDPTEEKHLAYIPTTYRQIGESLYANGEYKSSFYYLDKALNLAFDLFGRSYDCRPIYRSIAKTLKMLNDFATSIVSLEQVILINEDKGYLSPEVVIDYFDLSTAIFESGDTAKAIEICEKAYEISRNVNGDDNEITNRIKNYFIMMQKERIN